eukprot:2015514-Prymnesium_polylepis.2
MCPHCSWSPGCFPSGRKCPRRTRCTAPHPSSQPETSPSSYHRGTAAAPTPPLHSSSRVDSACTAPRPCRSGTSPLRTARTCPAALYAPPCLERTAWARRSQSAQRSPDWSACTRLRLSGWSRLSKSPARKTEAPMHLACSMRLARMACKLSRPPCAGTCPDCTAHTRPARPLERQSPPRTSTARRCPWAQRSPGQCACTPWRSTGWSRSKTTPPCTAAAPMRLAGSASRART